MICERFASEGCNVAVNYLSSEDKAMEVAAEIEKKYWVKAIIIQGVRLIRSQQRTHSPTQWLADYSRTPASVRTMQEWSKPQPRN